MANETLYHITTNSRAERIRSTALYPGETVDEHNSYVGMQGDPSQIYLWNAEEAERRSALIVAGQVPYRDPEQDTMLAVDIPDDHPVERDYDQFLFLLNDIEDEEWVTQWKDHYIDEEADGENWKVDFINTQMRKEDVDHRFNEELTEDNLRQFADSIPDDDWASGIGAYRTPAPIPGDYITDIGFEYFSDSDM